MNFNHVAAIANSNVTTYSVVFASISENGKTNAYVKGALEKEYTFKCTRSQAEELQKKEFPIVVVQSAGSLNLAVVVDVHDEPEIDTAASFQYKWVVCEVDLSEMENAIAEELRLVQALRKQQRSTYRDQLIKSLGFNSEHDLQLLLEEETTRNDRAFKAAQPTPPPVNYTDDDFPL